MVVRKFEELLPTHVAVAYNDGFRANGALPHLARVLGGS
jgi:hypothetical protein